MQHSQRLPEAPLRAGVHRTKLALYGIDLALAAAALCGALVLRYGFATLPVASQVAFATVVPFVAIAALVFPIAGLYARQWRYASVADLLAISKAAMVTGVLFFLVAQLDGRLGFLPPSFFLILTLLTAISLGVTRLALRSGTVRRMVRDLTGTSLGEGARMPVLLVGTGDNGDLYLKALSRDPNNGYRPVGFLTTDAGEVGSTLRGVPIEDTLDGFAGVVEAHASLGQRPRHVVFTDAVARFGRDEAQRLLDEAEALGLAVSCLSSPTELRNADAAAGLQLRRIELTDLLDRPQAALDRKLVSEQVRGRTVLVTGAGGSIGSELVRQLAAFGPAHLALVDHCEFNLYSIDRELREEFPDLSTSSSICDVRQKERLETLFAAHKPALVFNAAALKHVPMVELNPCEGVLTNVVGTANVAEAARRHGAVAMVQISTDKAVDSTSVMGASKRLGELYCQALDLEGLVSSDGEGSPGTRFMTVRFGNVLGSSGSLIPLFQDQLARGGPLTVTDPEMTRFFMTIREAVELTLQSCASGLAHDLGQGEIFVLDMGEPVRIMDIADRMIRLAGFTPQVDVEIEIVGCRPGEKLFEELFDTEEERVAVPVPGILGARPKPLPIALLRERTEQLEMLARGDRLSDVLAIMQELMPRYIPEQRHLRLAEATVPEIAPEIAPETAPRVAVGVEA